jgi:hypothetical protein
MGTENTLTGYLQRIDRRTIVGTASIYFAVLFISVLPPFFDIVNRAEPYIFNLPFILFWMIFVSVMMSIGLAALYWIENIRGEVV